MSSRMTRRPSCVWSPLPQDPPAPFIVPTQELVVLLNSSAQDLAALLRTSHSLLAQELVSCAQDQTAPALLQALLTSSRSTLAATGRLQRVDLNWR
uniref:Uncharacterized protein n=1 Tax=Arundo donax TaxID=35708 RepID=A0A0A9ATD0_ARUDO